MSICLTPTVERSFNGTAGTLLDLLEHWAARRGDDWAYRFLRSEGGEDSLSFAQLDAQARRIAAALEPVTQPGDRVLLVYPAGLDFIGGFFGCLYAGVLPVPATYPKPRRPMPRLSAIVADCGATAALTTVATLATLDVPRVAADLQSLHWLATDVLPPTDGEPRGRASVSPDDLAFLQYTSGSTSEPKGVMVSHANIMHNLDTIRQGFNIAPSSFGDPSNIGVFWLPAYHDMGLIGGILMPLYAGARSVLMSPTSFLQRPHRWLKAISDYKAKVSGAPNFAYDLCVRKVTPDQLAHLDLECWKLAFCGAEPIRPQTLEQFAATFAPCGFRTKAFYPCYGLAESTLLVAGRGQGEPVVKAVRRSSLANHRVEPIDAQAEHDVLRLVGCGTTYGEHQVLIVDTETHRPVACDEVGEIWVRGPSVTRGYWNRPRETAETFHAWLADGHEGPLLRTGDLGFVSDGQLFITGRAKDVIIIRGRNLYPQDIEHTVERAHVALLPGAGAAFAVEVDGEERLAIVHEVDRGTRVEELDDVLSRIRWAISEDYEVEPHAIVLIRQVSLPMTTSGKVQRSLCREQYLSGELRELVRWTNPTHTKRAAKINGHPQATKADGNGHAANGHSNGRKEPDRPALASAGRGQLSSESLSTHEVDRLGERVEIWLIDWLVQRAGVPRHEIERDKPFAEYGLDSLTAVELSQELEDWLGVKLNPVLAWNYPTPAALAVYLAGQVSGTSGGPRSLASPVTAAEPGGFEQLLADLETLSDADALSRLTGDHPRR